MARSADSYRAARRNQARSTPTALAVDGRGCPALTSGRGRSPTPPPPAQHGSRTPRRHAT